MSDREINTDPTGLPDAWDEAKGNDARPGDPGEDAPEPGDRVGLGRVVESSVPEEERERRHAESNPPESEVDEASAESFPGSDPPAFNATPADGGDE